MSTHASDTDRALSGEQTTWRIDPERSSVAFRAKAMWGLATVKGRFNRYEGRLDLAGTPAIELTIEAASLDTKNKRRDKHLRTDDFFGVEQFPYVRFVSESVALEGERLAVRGHLHARGTSIPLNLDATLRPDGDELEIEVVTVANQRLLGMTWNVLGTVGAPTTLIVKGRLVRDA